MMNLRGFGLEPVMALIEVLSQHLLGRAEENHEKSQPIYPVSRPIIEVSTPPEY
jgi:hypothetical protein